MSFTEFHFAGSPPQGYFASLGEVFRPEQRLTGPLAPKINAILRTIPLGWPAKLQERYGYQFLATETTDRVLGRVASRLRGGPIDMDNIVRHTPSLEWLERLVIDGPLAMQAARTAHTKLTDLLGKAPSDSLSAYERKRLKAFVDVLGRLVEKRHSTHAPKIVKLIKGDPDLGSPELLDHVEEIEAVHRFGAYVPMPEDRDRRVGAAGSESEHRAIFTNPDRYNPRKKVAMAIQAVFFNCPNLPGNIGHVLKGTNMVDGPIDSVAFVSISNGRVIKPPFAEAFIRETAGTIHQENSDIKAFYTLSPMPKFREWIEGALNEGMWDALGGRDVMGMPLPQLREELATISSNAELRQNSELLYPMQRLSFVFTTGNVKNDKGTYDWFNPISGKIHSSYGAEIARINFEGSPTDYSWDKSYGFTVNYHYPLIVDGVFSTAQLEANKIKHGAGTALLTESMAPLVKHLSIIAPLGPYSKYFTQNHPPQPTFG